MISLQYKPGNADAMKAYFEELYSRVPFFLGRPFRPPQEIYYLSNAEIGADRLYQAVHNLNMQVRFNAAAGVQQRFTIFGIHNQGLPVVIAGNSPSNTPLHEAIHYNGVHDETLTRFLTSIYYRRAAFNVGLLRQPVKYEAVPVRSDELDGILSELRLHRPPNANVELVHLRYVPPGG